MWKDKKPQSGTAGEQITFVSVFDTPETKTKEKDGNVFIELKSGNILYSMSQLMFIDAHGVIVKSYPRSGNLKDLTYATEDSKEFSVALTGLTYELMLLDDASVKELIVINRCVTLNDFLSRVAKDLGYEYIGFAQSLELVNVGKLNQDSVENLNVIVTSDAYYTDMEDGTKELAGQLEAFYNLDNAVGVIVPSLNKKFEFNIDYDQVNVAFLAGVIGALRAAGLEHSAVYNLGGGIEFTGKLASIDSEEEDFAHKVADILISNK